MSVQHNQLLQEDRENIEQLIMLFDSLFEQVKLQQEVRDRWFQHYLSIIGAVSALAALCFGFFSDHVSQKYLLLFIASVFFLAGILGILFYVLYMMQRQNYRKIYKGLEVLQDKICLVLLSDVERQQMIIHFKKHKKGADYITILIENIICSTCFAISTGFAMIALLYAIQEVFIISIILFVIVFGVLYIVYSDMEEAL